MIDKEWNNNNKINLLINNCINIENYIKEINILNQKIKKFSYKNKFKFIPEEDKITNLLGELKIFGEIYYNNFTFKKCPIKIQESRKYEVSGKKGNILTKTGTDCKWMGTICGNELEKEIEYKWTIKILKSDSKNIMVGVAPIDFDINSSSDKCGWYLHIHYNNLNPAIYSGPPHNYNPKLTNLNKVDDEIIVNLNMSKRTLKFIIDNKDYGDSYTNIPIDKPLFPVVLLYHKNDSVEIFENENDN